MAATAQQQLDAANDSLLRILQTDTSSWSEAQRMQQQLNIEQLERVIDRLERKVAASSSRPILQGIRRVNS